MRATPPHPQRVFMQQRRAVARRAGVVVNGRWISEDEIQERLAAIAASYVE